MPSTTPILVGCLATVLALHALPVKAQGDDGAGTSVDEAAKELLNPNNSLASLTFRNQYRWYDGELPEADQQHNYTMLFQPVFPLTLGETEAGAIKKLFIRPAIPIQSSIPTFDAADLRFDGESGLGDIGFDIAYGLSWPTGFQFAAGMVGSLPTATGDVPGGNTTLGSEVFVGQAAEFGFVGGLLTHSWDIDRWSDSEVNRTTLQPIFVYTLANIC